MTPITFAASEFGKPLIVMGMPLIVKAVDTPLGVALTLGA
jgi:hypothetical protein